MILQIGLNVNDPDLSTWKRFKSFQSHCVMLMFRQSYGKVKARFSQRERNYQGLKLNV